MLSLVFVETLYLYVENAVCIEVDAGFVLDILCEGFLVFLLDSHELCEDFLVVLEFSEVFKLRAVLYELWTDSLREKIGQSRI